MIWYRTCFYIIVFLNKIKKMNFDIILLNEPNYYYQSSIISGIDYYKYAFKAIMLYISRLNYMNHVKIQIMFLKLISIYLHIIYIDRYTNHLMTIDLFKTLINLRQHFVSKIKYFNNVYSIILLHIIIRFSKNCFLLSNRLLRT